MGAPKLAEAPVHDLSVDYANTEDMEVSSLLAEFSFLTPLLREIARESSAYFAGSTLSINISPDREGVDADQIAIEIHTGLAPREALARLREFDENWWLDNLIRARGHVSIDVAPL